MAMLVDTPIVKMETGHMFPYVVDDDHDYYEYYF